jgi:hypothetical protein
MKNTLDQSSDEQRWENRKLGASGEICSQSFWRKRKNIG